MDDQGGAKDERWRIVASKESDLRVHGRCLGAQAMQIRMSTSKCNAYGHVSNCRGLAQLQDEDEAATTSSFSASIA